MTTAYELALKALRPHLRSSRTPFEQSGGFLAEATTAIANANGSLDIIPLDILSYPVNLKTMWAAASFPVAILFREWMDDWYGLFPASIDFTSWYIIAMPGRDHDIYRAQALAEQAIRIDFNVVATVQRATLKNNRLMPVVSVSAVSQTHKEPAVEHEPENTAAPFD